MKKHFNMITFWITTEVATTPNLKKRIKTLTHCILLAEMVKKYNNWNGFLAVVSGLLQYPVTRLRQTWKSLSPAIAKKWDHFEKLISPVDNFRNLRECCDTSSPPSVLPISIILKDLIFIEDGNYDWCPNSQLLNFHKLEILGRVLGRMRESQVVDYPLSSVKFIQGYLNNLFYVEDVEILETQSKQIEPPNNIV